MPKIINYRVTPEQLTQLEAAMVSDPRMEVRRRATAIRLLHLGYRPWQVADILNIRYSTLQNWWHRWERGGLEALADQPRPGRPAKATSAYEQALDEILEHPPSDYGYPFALWTIDRLRLHLAQTTGISLSRERFRVLLKARDWVYRRPKKDLKGLQDREARAQVEELLEELKKGRSQVLASSSLWTKRA